MPLFALIGLDHPNALERRMAARPEHLSYLETQTGVKIKVAGPMLSDEGDPVGSLLVVEAPDRAAVEAFRDADPYTRVGLFQSFEIRGFRAALVDPF